MGKDTALLSARGLKATYGPITAINIDHLEVGSGDILAVVGPSGAGKSTLLRCLALLQPIGAGEIVFEGDRVFGDGAVRANEDTYRRWVSLVQQDGFLWLDKTVLENVSLAEMLLGSGTPDESRMRSRDLLGWLEIGDAVDRYPNELSGGERQRVALARTLIRNPKILLLDEPTNNLDEKTANVVATLLREYVGTGGTIIMATHNTRFALGLASSCLLIEDGQVIDRGDIASLRGKSEESSLAG